VVARHSCRTVLATYDGRAGRQALITTCLWQRVLLLRVELGIRERASTVRSLQAWSRLGEGELADAQLCVDMSRCVSIYSVFYMHTSYSCVQR
jgi:hypothetical protein